MNWNAHIRESHGDQGYYHLVDNSTGQQTGTRTVIDVPAWDEIGTFTECIVKLYGIKKVEAMQWKCQHMMKRCATEKMG